MVGKDTAKLLQFLAGSRCRVTILSELCENGSLHRTDFDRILDTARTTITRNLDALINHDLVERQSRTYYLTLQGEFIASELADLVEIIQATDKLKPILEQLSVSEIEFDPLLLAEGTVTVSSSSNPYAPVNQHIGRMGSAHHVKCLLPSLGFNPLRAAERGLLDSGAKHELVVDTDVAETFRSNPEYTEPLNHLLDTGILTLYVSDEEIPYYLGVLDDTVQIGVSDEGIPRALLETKSDDVKEQAVDILNNYIDKSKQINKLSSVG
ncbi:helix-turn-helix transcriptional regulator [Haloferax sp. YSSS75]|uniref:helix-turn-helix transcriptional regulator n=1 Tax=Haloferax sp. YSSS75 TaxID=3388564 RepID=UPI00398D462D